MGEGSGPTIQGQAGLFGAREEGAEGQGCGAGVSGEGAAGLGQGDLATPPSSVLGGGSFPLPAGWSPSPCSPTPEVSLISRGGYDITALSRGWDALRNPWAVQAKAFSARDPRRGRWGHSPRLQPRFLPLRGEQGGPGMKRGERGQPRALSALLLPKPAGAGLRPASPTRPPDVPAALQAVGLGSVPELPDPTLRAGAR